VSARERGRQRPRAQLAAAVGQLLAGLEGTGARPAVTWLRNLTGASACAVYRFEPATGELSLLGTTADALIAAGAPPELDEAIRSGSPVRSRAAGPLAWAAGNAASLLACPLFDEDGPVGGILLLFDGRDDEQLDELTELLGRESAEALADLRLQQAGVRALRASEHLMRLSSALTFATSADGAARAVVRDGREILGAASGVLLTLEGDELVLLASSGLRSRDLRPWRVTPVSGPTPFAEALSAGRPVYLPSAATLVRRFPDATALAALGETMAVLPLTIGERPLGVMAFGFAARHALASDVTELMLLLGRHAAQALARLALAAQRDRTAAFERRFRDVTAALSVAATPDAVIRIAVDDAPAAFGAAAALVALHDPGHDRLVLRARGGPLARLVPGDLDRSLPPGHPLHEVLRSREIAISSSPESLRQEYPDAFVDRHSELQALVAMPLHAEEPLGSILLAFDRQRSFGEDERAALRRFAERTADAITRSRLLIAERAARHRSELLQAVAASLNARADAPGVARAMLTSIVRSSSAAEATVAVLGRDVLEPLATMTAAGRGPAELSSEQSALATAAITAEQALTARAAGGGELLAAPLVARGVTFGAVVVRMPERDPDPPDITGEVLETIGRMAGAALDRAEAHARDHRVAEELQVGLLGRASAPVENLLAGARYRPGDEGMKVGGDWYDIVPLDGGRVLLTVGDVVGSGLQAAATMGQLRGAVATLAPVLPEPGRLLDELSRFAETTEAARYATVCLVLLDIETGEMSYAAAGHPPPLVVAEGRGRYLWSGRSEPLACGTGAPRPQGTDRLEPGATVLLYTDGLVERRDAAIDAGLDRLCNVACELSLTGAGDLSERVLDAMLTGVVRHDDAVVLSAMLHAVPVETLRYEMPKHAAAIAEMRRAVREWLRSRGTDEPTVDDLVLLVNEAAANAVEHGQGHDDEPVVIRLAFDPRSGVVEGSVTAAGGWREARPDTGERGRGLQIIRRLADDLALERRGGTTLSFRRATDAVVRR
jgi:GAF domain-containing protein/anti-sigma regulatory factor (Ser/Thr protein kinase)